MSGTDSSAPFYQQLTSRFVGAIVLVALLIIAIFSIFFFREQQIQTLISKELPQLVIQDKQQILLSNTRTLAQQVLKTSDEEKLSLLLIDYQDSLLSLAKQLPKQRANLTRFDSELAAITTKIQRLVENKALNIALKNDVLVQLELINSALSEISDKQLTNYEQLRDQLIANRSTDSVMASRGKAIASLSDELMFYQRSLDVFIDAERVFSTLAITTSLIEFDQLTDDMTLLMAQWREREVQPNDQAKDVALLVADLDKLLWQSNRAFAKWRGHIRLADEVYSSVDSQLQQLSELSLPRNTLNTSKYELVPSIVKQWLPNGNKVSMQYYFLGLFGLILIGFAITSFVIWQIRSKIKQHNLHNVELVKAVVQDKEADFSSQSLEELQFIELVQTIQKPEYSVKDYHQLQQKLSDYLQLINQHLHAVCWQANTNNDLAYRLLGLASDSANLRSWRRAFSKENTFKIISAAKEAKSSERSLTLLSVETIDNRQLLLTLENKESGWQGTLSEQKKQAQLSQQKDQLEQAMQLAQQHERKQRIENTQKLNNMLLRTMLQSQNASLGSNLGSQQVYRHLARIVEWSTQLQLSTLLANKDKHAQLTDVALNNELMTLVANISHDANSQRNKVSYLFDDNIIEESQLNVCLFHQAIASFCQLLLQDQFKSHLLFMVDVADKNAGQQILTFTFKVENIDHKPVLPDVINRLIDFTSDNLEEAPQLVRYYYRLFNVLHGSDLNAKNLEHGYQIMLTMPVTIVQSQSKQVKQTTVDFKQANILLFLADKNVENSLRQRLKENQAKLTSMSQSKSFAKQLSVKNLTKTPISLVIIGADCLNEDLEIVNQHIQSLPERFRPKVLVLQPQYNQAFHRVGMYQDCHLTLANDAFVSHIHKVIKGKASSNLLLAPELFSQYRFSSSQVEVLVAVSEPMKHQVLLRLLHWMGLQIHLVCNEKLLAKQWQTGRYMLLVSEFTYSPIVDLNVGKKVKRAIFCFDSKLTNKFTVDVEKAQQSWQVNTLPNVLDVAALVKGFSPWIKEQITQTPVKAKIAKGAEKPASAKTEVKNKAASSLGIEPMFDIAQYAHNQGSTELAVFMMDDYIKEIALNISTFEQAINEKHKQNADEALRAIIKVATILVAEDLLAESKKTQGLLAANNYTKCLEGAERLRENHQLVKDFAEAI